MNTTCPPTLIVEEKVSPSMEPVGPSKDVQGTVQKPIL